MIKVGKKSCDKNTEQKAGGPDTRSQSDFLHF